MKRKLEESFEDYKLRRSIAQEALKLHRKGVLWYSGFANPDHRGKAVPYVNHNRSHLYARHRNQWHHARDERALALYGGS